MGNISCIEGDVKSEKEREREFKLKKKRSNFEFMVVLVQFIVILHLIFQDNVASNLGSI